MEERAVALFHRSIAFYRRGQARQAIAALDEALIEAGDDLDLIVPILNQRGLVEKREGNYAAARQTYAKLVQIFEARGDLNPLIFATILDNLGFIEREAGDLAMARRAHERAVTILRSLEEPRDLAHALISLAIVEKDLGLLQQAKTTIAEAFPLIPASDTALVSLAHTVNGLNFQLLEDWDAARREYVAALLAARTIQDAENVAILLHNLATVDHERGKTGTARRLLRHSMWINKRLRIKAGVANDLRRLALYTIDDGAKEEGGRLLLRARNAARKAGDLVLEAWCELERSRLALLLDDPRAAWKLTVVALHLAQVVGAPYLLQQVRLTRGISLRRLGRLPEAADEFRAAAVESDRLREGAVTEDLSLRFFNEESDAHHNLVQVSIDNGNAVEAWSWAEQARARELDRRLRRSLTLQPHNASAGLAAHERDLLSDLNATLMLIESESRGSERVPRILNELRLVWEELRLQDSEYADIRSGRVLTYGELRRELETWSRTMAS